MAQDAEIKLVLDTSQAISEAKAFTPKLEKALSVKGPIAEIEKYQQELHKLATDKELLNKKGQLTGPFNIKNLEKYEDKFKDLFTKAEELKRVNAELEKRGITPDTEGKAIASMRGKIGAAVRRGETGDEERREYQEVNALIEKRKALEAVVTTEYNKQKQSFENMKSKVDSVVTAEKEHGAAVDAVNTKYEEIKAKAESSAADAQKSADAEKKSAEAAGESADKARQDAEATKEAARATDELANAKAKAADQTTAKERSDEGIVGSKKSEDELKKAEEDAKKFQETLKQINDATSRVNSAMQLDPAINNIAELVRRLMELQQAKRALEGLGIPEGQSDTYNQIVQNITTLKQQIKDCQKNMQGLGTTSQQSGEQVKEGSERAQEGLDKATTSARNFKSVSSKIGSGIKAGFNGIKTAIGVVKKGLDTLSRTADKVKSSFNRFAHSSQGDFKHMLTSLTKYVLGFRSLFFLVRRLRKYIGEGIKNMAQFNNGNNDVNRNITELLSSLLYLKNAWATAFSPILSFVTPWLRNLIDTLAAAGNAFSRFIGVLLEQSQVFQAIKVSAKDYGKSLDSAGSSAGGAAKKQKELNDRLAAFDDLNVLGVDKNNNGTGGGGGGSVYDYEPDPNKMFKIAKAFSELGSMIKDAIANGMDFTNVGDYISDKIVDMLKNIKFGDIKKKAGDIGYGISTFITGLFDNEELWTQVGRVIAQGINTASTFVERFLQGTSNLNWGGGLATLVNRMFGPQGIDWAKIEDNIKNFVTQFTTNIANALNGITWADVQKGAISFGNTLANIITGTLGNEEFMRSLGLAGAQLLNAILNAIKATISGTNGEDISKAIYSFFHEILDKVQWGDIAKNISGLSILSLDIITSISDELAKDDAFQKALSDFFTNLDLGSVMEALGKNISSSVVTANTLGTAIASVLNTADVADKVIDGINGLLNNLDVTKLISSTVEFITRLLWYTATDPMLPAKIGAALLDVISEGIANWFIQNNTDETGVTDWGDSWGEFIIKGLINGIENAIIHMFDPIFAPFEGIGKCFEEEYEINSPSKVFERYGEYLIEGLLNGVNNLIETVMEPFTTLAGDLATKWTEIKISATQKWSELKNTLYEKAGEIKSKLSEVWTNIKGDAATAWVTLRITAVQAFTQLKEALKSPINGVISVVESMVNRIINGINSVVDKINSLPDIKFTNPFTGSEYKLGFTVPRLSTVSIPRLAQGAVIPPNREFMAVLGDQSHGTNVEAPLDTIKQAVAEVMANNGNAEMIQLLQQLIAVVESKNLTIGDKEIGKANARYMNQQRLIRGTSF